MGSNLKESLKQPPSLSVKKQHRREIRGYYWRRIWNRTNWPPAELFLWGKCIWSSRESANLAEK